MTIQVNGETQEVFEGLTVSGLLQQLKFPGDRVAVERNLEIVPRALWEETLLTPGDRFEIVHFVGGGREIARRAPPSKL